MKVKTYEVSQEIPKAVMVQVVFDSKKENPTLAFSELKSLIEADRIKVVGQILQNRNKPDPATMIGEGKLEELKELVESTQATMVVFKNDLGGSKIRNLEDYLQIKVMDRTMLILDIFAQRATSQEGKLQVELAQLKYTLPRLAGLKGSFGRFGGGVGMRGPGETKLELDRRIIENRIVEKRRELKKVEDNRNIRRSQRLRSGKYKVSIVGYTNGGKSSLLNCITKAETYVQDMLFATLDTTTRNLWLGIGKEILLTDTVGFVSDLPHDLVNAFHSTLQEAMDADLLIHVIDISDENCKQKIEIVNDVLVNLGGANIPVIKCYNKIDKVTKEELLEYEKDENAVMISAKNKIGIDVLKAKIEEILFPNMNKEY